MERKNVEVNNELAEDKNVDKENLQKSMVVTKNQNNNIEISNLNSLKRGIDVNDREKKPPKRLKTEIDYIIITEDAKEKQNLEKKHEYLRKNFRNFFQRRRKKLIGLTQEELLDLFFEKFIESFVANSKLSDLKRDLDNAVNREELLKVKCENLAKQLEKLERVIERFKLDQKSGDKLATPVIIKRNVGIQVSCFQKDKIVNLKEIRKSDVEECQNEKTENQNVPVNKVPVIPDTEVCLLSSDSEEEAETKITTGQNSSETEQKCGDIEEVCDLLELESTDVEQPKNGIKINDPDNRNKEETINTETSNESKQTSQNNLDKINSEKTLNASEQSTVTVDTNLNAIAAKPSNILDDIRQAVDSVSTSKENKNSIKFDQCEYEHQPLPPLPKIPKCELNPVWKSTPPSPLLKVGKLSNAIFLSWDMPSTGNYEDISVYQIFVCPENIQGNSAIASWRKIGDIKALSLPMACTLTQFKPGFNYHFAMRAVDIYSRVGQYSALCKVSL